MIKIPLYEVTINLKVYDTFKDMVKAFSKLQKRLNIEEDGPDDYYAGRTIVDGNKIHIFILHEYLNINTICHEVYHTTNRILANQGVDLDPYNDESFAILNGYLNQEVFNFLKKKGFEIK